jgi:hypothetical protein
MTDISPEMTGTQHSCCASNKIARKCKQKYWLPTIALASSLLKHMGLHPLQDDNERRCQDQPKNMEELVHFLQDFMRPCILCWISILFCCCNVANLLTNLLEVLLHLKHKANLIKFGKINNNGTPIVCFTFPAFAKASGINGYGIYSSCGCCRYSHHHVLYPCSSCCWL